MIKPNDASLTDSVKKASDEVFVISANDAAAGKRLDAWLAETYEEFSRSFIQRLIRSGRVCVGSKPVKSSYRLRGDEEIHMTVPPAEEAAIEPEDLPLDIVYEDDDILIVNKPKNMVVHPAPGHYSGTLVNALMYHCRDRLSGINGVLRPGIVHRIDRDTTGLLVICKNDAAHAAVASQLAEHSITRRYTALVYGNLNGDRIIDAPIARSRTNRLKMAVDPIDGKRAVTHVKVLERFSGFTLVECRLETGRTHQIRVHMAHIGHPVAGDPLYGPGDTTIRFRVHENDAPRTVAFTLNGQALHARLLGLIHPSTGEYMEWEAPLPEYFEELLAQLRS